LCFSLALIAFLKSFFVHDGTLYSTSYDCDVRLYTASGSSCEGKKNKEEEGVILRTRPDIHNIRAKILLKHEIA